MIPPDILTREQAFLTFGYKIVQTVFPFAAAVKFNHAHFAAARAEHELEQLIASVQSDYPDLPVILDAKRGDVSSTAERYAEEVFGRYRAGAATVSPYLGWDTIEPFRAYESRGVIVLCKTSNPGAAWIQDEPSDDPLYLRVASRVQDEHDPNLMIVVGATHIDALARTRAVAPDGHFSCPWSGGAGRRCQPSLATCASE